ncbi:lysine exporter LysO family protein [Brackiella oedipodis]|uniref:lysine exporter LysO family protein n=1 Tax=Brackiella oedipodis TaxID=124225 RepID=UPI00049199DC|nr:lysine exporter LysO family protein [Brackiella oedipodis]
MQILSGIWPIALALVIGLISATYLPKALKHWLITCIGRFISLLLVAIGYNFAANLERLGSVTKLIGQALLYAGVINLFIVIAITLMFGVTHAQALVRHGHHWRQVIWDCAHAFLCLALGMGLQFMVQSLGGLAVHRLNIDYFLYVLLFLIGIDIRCTQFSVQRLSLRVFVLPLIIIVVSLAASALLAHLLGMNRQLGLLVGSGFGWFSLSGAFVTAQLGEYYGALCMLTDLFREIMSIFILFALGRHFPYAGIATTAATGMDTTLPIVRKACGENYTAVALYVGFVCSVAAPFLIGIFVSLAKSVLPMA